jgi:Tol biopolymer transport system component
MRSLIALCALVVLAVSGASADRLLFVSGALPTGPFNINSIGADGQRPETLLLNTGIIPQSGASLSPDGAQIAFVAERDEGNGIFIIDIDGGHLRYLVDGSHPAFSPDGRRIAYSARNADNNIDIYTIDIGGTDPIRLTTHDRIDEIPTFSPDGTKIAFTSIRDSARDLFIINTDGTGLLKLTDDRPSDAEAAFSPDGTKIAFAKGSFGSRDIYLINADGSGLAEPIAAGPEDETDPLFSPDGEQIAFLRLDGSDTRGPWETYIQYLSGGLPIQVTNFGQLNWTFGWVQDTSATAVEALSWAQVKIESR